MDKQKKKDIEAMEKDQNTHQGEIWHKWVVFDVGEEVEPYFYNNCGVRTNQVWINGSNAGESEWVFF